MRGNPEWVGRRGRVGRSRPRIAVGAVALAVMVVAVSPAQEAADFFRQNCQSCHTIGGGRLVGPDLKNVTQRKDRDWLITFITNPQAAINRGDPYALRLREEARGVVMPTVPGITRDRARALLDLIEAESKLEKSHFAGAQISDRPFTPDDVRMGEEIFTGRRGLRGGGPACISCHTVHGMGGLSGGRLGPDLTKVYERIGGRTPLAAWLVSPATTTMRPVFKEHPLESEEILPLVAYLERKTQEPSEDNAAAPVTFFLIGLVGAALVLAGFDKAWRWRFRAARRPLVDAS